MYKWTERLRDCGTPIVRHRVRHTEINIERDRFKDTGGETKREKRDKEITIESDRLIKTA